MGFSIGSLIGGLAPIIGGIFGGPVGAAVGGVVGGAFDVTRRRVSTLGPFEDTPLASQVGPTVQRRQVLSQVPSLIGRSAGMIAELLRVARETTGGPVNVQRVIDAIRVCGIEQAANIFGLSTGEICQIAISKRRRRSRGISAADLRRTRSTIRKIHNMQHSLKALTGPVRRHHK